VIDADHQANPAFAHETLGYFADEKVAFVCTPQRHDTGGQDPLNNEEAFFTTVFNPLRKWTRARFHVATELFTEDLPWLQWADFQNGISSKIFTLPIFSMREVGKAFIIHGR